MHAAACVRGHMYEHSRHMIGPYVTTHMHANVRAYIGMDQKSHHLLESTGMSVTDAEVRQRHRHHHHPHHQHHHYHWYPL